ncbi:MAG: hypothetical protein ACM33T_12485 [Solirubrobacterales bacterium]
MRPVLTALLLAALALPAAAQELPKFPKAAPPEPTPDPICDTAKPSGGDWLLGRWVAPNTKWSFERAGGAIGWTLERKGSINQDFGWQDGATITGTVDKVSGCTVSLKAGQGDFLFDGVLTEDGKLYGYAVNKAGQTVRFVLRRER